MSLKSVAHLLYTLLVVIGPAHGITFSEWSDGYGLTTEQRTPAATPNGDGIQNAMKYFLGIAPLEQVPLGLMPQPALKNQNDFLMSVNRHPASEEAVSSAELSSNLSSWDKDLSQLRILNNSNERFEVAIDLPAEGPVFLRMAVDILDSEIPWSTPSGTLIHQFSESSLQASIGSMPGIWFEPLTTVNFPTWGFSNNQGSEGYESASGGTNLYANELVPVNAAGENAPYMSINLTPAVDESIHITNLSFGARTLVYPVVDPGPGPKRYELRTSIDDFASPLVQGDFNTSQGENNYWYHYEHGLSAYASPGETVEVRLYFLEATEGTRGGAFRIDDFAISASTEKLVKSNSYYVSTNGDDTWSGTLPEPNEQKTDGPFASLDQARNILRIRYAQSPPEQPVEVLIREGTYHLDKPVVFTPLDSGTIKAPITYKAYPGEAPVFSGGQPITGWTETEQGKHEVMIPNAQNRNWVFRQLFIDGQRMTLARTPNEGYFRMAGPADPEQFPPETTREERYYTSHFYRFHQGQLKNWPNLSDVNIVAFYSWHAGILPLTWVDEASRTFHTDGSMRNGYGGKVGEEMRFYVENAPDALDSPEEWRLDRDSGKLRLLGFPGETLDDLGAVAPVAEQLLILDGDPLNGEWVEHLRFEGLSFQHTAFNLPADGISDTQGSVFVAGGTVEILGSRNIEFIGNEIAHTGGHGLWIRRGSNNIKIFRNHIHDLGGGGVYVGNRDRFTRIGDTFTPPPEGITAFVTLGNNYIHDTGSNHRQAHGIWIGQSSDNIIRNNEISHTDYSAVALGWSWGFSPSACNRNLVEYNHIHSVLQNVFADGGGVYTLGEQLGTVIRHNLIHDVWGHREYQGKGFYPDEGSSGILFSHNIVHGTSAALFGVNYGNNLTVRNNIFAFNASGGAIERGNNGGGRNLNLVFEKNIVLLDHPRVFEAFGTLASLESNLYWNRNGSIRFQGGANLSQWQAATGLDTSSQVADPLFTNADAGDFILQAGSPAFGLGIEAIDASQIGLYGDPEWINLPLQVAASRAPNPLPPFAHAFPDPRDESGDIFDDFEAGLNLYINQLNASNSVGPLTPYLSVTLQPDPEVAVDVSSVSFAARSLVDPFVPGGTGPTHYELRTSADGFSSPIASGFFETAEGDHNYWYYHNHGSLAENVAVNAALELRIYLLGASGGLRAGTFRIDDLSITAKALPDALPRVVSYRFTDNSKNPTEGSVAGITAGPLALANVATSGFSRQNATGGYLNSSGEVVLADLDAEGRYASGGRSASGNISFSSARAVSGQRSLLMLGESRFVYQNRRPLTVDPLVDGGNAEASFFVSYQRGQSSMEARWVDERGRQGPTLSINGNTGQLRVNGDVLTTLPEGAWVEIGLQAMVGLANNGKWTLTVILSGQNPLTFNNLTFSSDFNEWQNMEWTVTDGNPSDPAGFYLDDVTCQ